jgi:CheY-like chemotaxis protein
MGNKTMKRVLVVEDEWLIAVCLEETLAAQGLAVVGPVPSVSMALDLIEAEPLDFALLDVSLGSEKSFPVADRLKSLGVPFLFLTGYGFSDLPKAFAEVPLVAKPIREADLRKALSRHMADNDIEVRQ